MISGTGPGVEWPRCRKRGNIMRPFFLLPLHEAEMVSFKCAGCQAPFNVSADRAGMVGQCPKCQLPFTVPPSADEPQPPGRWALPRGPIRLVRLGQALDLAALVALAFAVAVMYFGAFAGAGERARQIRDEREQIRSQFERDAQAWLRRKADGDDRVQDVQANPDAERAE